MSRVNHMIQIQLEALTLFEKKNKDYGDSFSTYGPIGVLVRMQDKINRCISLSQNGINLVEDENLRDTLIDLYNYSAMTIMLLDSNKSI